MWSESVGGRGALRRVSVDHRVEVVEFGVAGEVAPHLAGRFPVEYEADGEDS